MNKRERARQVRERLQKMYSNAASALNFTNRFEMTVAVQLSAQSTDVGVNKVTKKLFQQVRNWQELAEISRERLEQLIFASGFYHQKAKNLRACARMVLEKYDGDIPDDMEALVGLPGVGRKTANILLLEGYGRAEGIAVDTHLLRISRRLRLSKHADPNKVEQDLLQLFPKSFWPAANHVLIAFGRETCSARKPKCSSCPLLDICPFREKYL